MTNDSPAEQIAIYGAGAFAREVAWLVQSCNVEGKAYEVVCFMNDNPASHGSVVNDIPVMGHEAARKQYPLAKAVLGVGMPAPRQRLAEKAGAAGFEFATIIHPRVERSRWIEIGDGTVICAGNILTTNITLGRHVQINLACTVGHDAIMGDFTTLAPGVHVSGYVHLGKRVYVGTGAVFVNGTKDSPITVGDDVVIGAGACVTKSIQEGLTVAGVPARPLPDS
jgi:sugar O-acyltransferase (sialic acid O-acetyltransferase NeuD family)